MNNPYEFEYGGPLRPPPIKQPHRVPPSWFTSYLGSDVFARCFPVQNLVCGIECCQIQKRLPGCSGEVFTWMSWELLSVIEISDFPVGGLLLDHLHRKITLLASIRNSETIALRTSVRIVEVQVVESRFALVAVETFHMRL